MSYLPIRIGTVRRRFEARLSATFFVPKTAGRCFSCFFPNLAAGDEFRPGMSLGAPANGGCNASKARDFDPDALVDQKRLFWHQPAAPLGDIGQRRLDLSAILPMNEELKMPR